jgi:hypothetical protein
MSDRGLSDERVGRAAAKSVTSVANETSFHRLIDDPARDKSEIFSYRVVLGKLMNDSCLSLFVASEYEQSAGITIDPMDREQSWLPLMLSLRTAPPGRVVTHQSRHTFIQRWLLVFAGPRPGKVRFPPECYHARRLFDNHDIVVDIMNRHLLVAGGWRDGTIGNCDNLAIYQSPSFIDTQHAADCHTTTVQYFPHGGPGWFIWQMLSHRDQHGHVVAVEYRELVNCGHADSPRVNSNRPS